jgi:hypothetical protein
MSTSKICRKIAQKYRIHLTPPDSPPHWLGTPAGVRCPRRVRCSFQVLGDIQVGYVMLGQFRLASDSTQSQAYNVNFDILSFDILGLHKKS